MAGPALYYVSGVLTFIVHQDGVLYEKDLGAGTDAAVRAMTAYDPDATWSVVQ